MSVQEPAPSTTTTEDFNAVSHVSSARRTHILYGDKTGGGHLYGVGKPCKSEFPKDWSAEKIINEVELIAANDNIPWRKERNGYHKTEQFRDGIKVRVIKGRQNAQVITAYPLNVTRNPCER